MPGGPGQKKFSPGSKPSSVKEATQLVLPMPCRKLADHDAHSVVGEMSENLTVELSRRAFQRSAAAACSACLTPWHRLELTHRDLFILQHDALDHARVNTKS